MNLDIEEVFVGSKTMMPLSLIINEMISNSLKYAFEGRDEGEISIKFSKLNENCELIVSDDGVGYTPDPKSDGLGLRLISSFTRQLNGVIEQINDSGTTFKLTFKSVHKTPKLN